MDFKTILPQEHTELQRCILMNFIARTCSASFLNFNDYDFKDTHSSKHGF